MRTSSTRSSVALTNDDIRSSIETFLGGTGKDKGRGPNDRNASFDYCFNHFRSFYERGRVQSIADPPHLELSCLHIAWYLASWGMLRGSSYLLEKSLHFYEPLIAGIASSDLRFWEIDVPRYDTESITLLLDCAAMIREKLRDGDKVPSSTLVTKIMLGVFGNVPALDQYFGKAFGIYSPSRRGLLHLHSFYEQHKDALDTYRIPTLDLATEAETGRFYPMAKVIDMVGFTVGQNRDEQTKSEIGAI